MDDWDNACGVADQGSGPNCLKVGPESVFQLSWDHTLHPPQESLLQGFGREALTNCPTADSRGTVWLLSWSINIGPDLHTWSGVAKVVMGVCLSSLHVFVDLEKARFSQELGPVGSGATAAVFCFLDWSDQGILLDYQAPYSSACDGLAFKDWHHYTDFVPSADFSMNCLDLWCPRELLSSCIWLLISSMMVLFFLTGTSVMKVTASDADDPTYGNSARIVYSVLDGEKFFTVDRHTGIIMTAVADLDRETQDRYELVVKATDMAGQMGGLSGSTTVTIVITDVNDNPPRFPQKMYQFSVSEGAAVGTPVGRVIATDADMGENTDMSYLIKEGGELFKVTTDVKTQEAVVSIKKMLDFESKQTHNVVVEAVNKHVDPRFVDLGSFRDQTIVCVSVSDIDEPPMFQPAEGTIMEVQEDAKVGSVVGIVTARDPDVTNKPVRFSIDRTTDQDLIFHIDPDSGAITLGKTLDRETAGWHNITVKAVEADNHSMVSYSPLSIRILDVNDNPPELATPYEASICEDAKPGQLIHTISVVDKDEPQSGHRFVFTLPPEATSSRHFILWDVKDNTAGIRTQKTGFNRHEQNVYFLPILVVDSGPPSLSSTGTLTIHVCGCDTEGAIQSCNATAYVMSAALSPGALIALLVCMLILLVLVLLILTLKRHRKGQRMTEDEEDMRDNVIKYNDEGGGEQDTEAYDMSALRNLYDFPEAKTCDSGPDIRSLPQWIQANRVSLSGDGATAAATDFSLFKGYIRKKVEQADADLTVPPYDSFQTYAFEGTSSPALSLSSIHTLSNTSEQDFSYLHDWGPRFRQLAGYYAPGNREEEGS
ncbi:cadherin-22 [Nematolebias whitei]|uniref:cadherin-22 n=1 Tax=Nematolebias whitei TaxID=451745 RepID=UPI00189C1711|nr:cadherin-22 [Nematolebias whitei]